MKRCRSLTTWKVTGETGYSAVSPGKMKIIMLSHISQYREDASEYRRKEVFKWILKQQEDFGCPSAAQERSCPLWSLKLPPIVPKLSQLPVVNILDSSRVVETCSMSLCSKKILGQSQAAGLGVPAQRTMFLSHVTYIIQVGAKWSHSQAPTFVDMGSSSHTTLMPGSRGDGTAELA